MSRPKIKLEALIIARSVITNDTGQVLLLKRKKDKSYNPNKWELPGGKLPYGCNIKDGLIDCTLQRIINCCRSY